MKISIFIFTFQVLLVFEKTLCKENAENYMSNQRYECRSEQNYTMTRSKKSDLREFLLEYNSISQSSSHNEKFDVKKSFSDFNVSDENYDFKNKINFTHLIPLKEKKSANNNSLKNVINKKKNIEINLKSKSIDEHEMEDGEEGKVTIKNDINPQMLNNFTMFNEFTMKNLMTNNTEINFQGEKSIEQSIMTNSTLTDIAHFQAKKMFTMKDYNEVCNCDLKLHECDINCCCDNDCSVAMKKIFTSCESVENHVSANNCYDSKLLFKNNFKDKIKENGGLFCLLKNNLNPQLLYKEQSIIGSVKSFKSNLMSKKLFRFSSRQFEKPKIQKKPYKIGDYLWNVEKNELTPFGVPQHIVHMKCNSMRNIQYLTDYLTKCIHSVPKSKNECENAMDLKMFSYLKNINIIKSPDLFEKNNSSDDNKSCTNEICVSIEPYICPEDPNLKNCVKAKPKKPVWNNNVCENIVTSVEYYVFHNGSDGIKEMRAHFVLNNISSVNNKELIQSIKLKFLWAESTEHIFVRSGNPGYLIGKPIMAGKKIYYSNETAGLKKEGIQVSLDSKHWLTVFGTKAGICSNDNRRTINFGENAFYKCSIILENFYFFKSKCIDLQEIVFHFLIGDDFKDIKLNNRFNKFVATFANSRAEDTGDWVQIVIDTLPITSNQVNLISHLDYFLCKNIFIDLYIDVAYTKIGSFGKPQAKILGVYFHFGPPADIMYFKSYFDKSHKTVKISTFLQFIDLTNEAVKEFAEPPGFEAKLPHNFFYPFFSEGSLSRLPFCLLIMTLVNTIFISLIQKAFIS